MIVKIHNSGTFKNQINDKLFSKKKKKNVPLLFFDTIMSVYKEMVETIFNFLFKQFWRIK